MYIEIKETFLELPSEIQFSEAANAAILTQDKWGDVWQTLKTDADLNYTDAGEPVSLASRVTTATSAIYHAITEGWTMCVGYSGGKDSHSLLHLFLMALIRAVRNGSNVSQHHFIQISNTNYYHTAPGQSPLFKKCTSFRPQQSVPDAGFPR